MKGVVKWWNDKKGFGFIEVEARNDVFVHFSQILTEEFQTLYEGEIVEFDIESTGTGDRAINVKRIGRDSESIVDIELVDGQEEMYPKSNPQDIIEFLKWEHENLLRIIGDNHNEFNKGRIYAMNRMIDGLEGIYNNI